MMQVTETVSDGLKREFKVVVPAADLATKADARLGELKDQVRINGFRRARCRSRISSACTAAR